MKLPKQADSSIDNILVISLSNIGDAVLTTPVISVLKKQFILARISVVVGPKAREIFEHAPYLDKVFIYNKHMSFSDKYQFIRLLRKESFNLVIDLRHTLIPLFLNTKYRTKLVRKRKKDLPSVADHLSCLEALGINARGAEFILPIHEKDRKYARKILRGSTSSHQYKIAIAPGAASDLKRWSQEKFYSLAKQLEKCLNVQIIFVGDDTDKERFITYILVTVGLSVMGQTSLMQLGALIEQVDLLITGDSAPLHIARAVKTPVIALFGPTDYIRYGPHRNEGLSVRLDIPCSPCRSPVCKEQRRMCLDDLTVETVFSIVEKRVKQEK
ncbi:glycosyltransferase family 9 protein [Chlamydiota bacterium]